MNLEEAREQAEGWPLIVRRSPWPLIVRRLPDIMMLGSKVSSSELGTSCFDEPRYPAYNPREVIPELGGGIQGGRSHTIEDLPLGAIGQDASSSSMEL